MKSCSSFRGIGVSGGALNITQELKDTFSEPTRPTRAASKKRIPISLLAALLALLYGASPGTAATSKPDLGAAQGFAVLGGAVTLTGSPVTGDVGAYPGAITLTGSPVTGSVVPNAQAAMNDFSSAYVALKNEPCTVSLSGSLAGRTLAPGVYCFDGAVTETGGVLTLSGDANGIWIFKIGTSGFGALTGTGFSVVMANGGQSGNVYWSVAEAATLTDSNFRGTILAGVGLTVTGGSLEGQALTSAAVTFTSAAVTIPNTVTASVILVSAAVVTGPYTDAAGQSVNLATKTITVPMSGSMHYYLIRSGTALTITSISLSGGNLVITYN